MITAIDTHCHIHYGPKEKLTDNYLSKLMQEGNLYSAYPDVLQRISESARIEKVFASPFDGVLDSERVEEANEDMFKIAAANEFLYQWLIIDPRNDNTFAQAERMLNSEKCVGIKLHPVCHKYSILEYGDKIFSFADARSAIVQIHPEKKSRLYHTFCKQIYENKVYYGSFGRRSSYSSRQKRQARKRICGHFGNGKP